ncbi:MAG TPA: YdeI/OmpD-associated family protein [Caulobacteraceae bacterium]
MPAPDLPLLTFRDAAAFEAWLDSQPATSAGAWLCFAKAGAPAPTLSKSEALDCAIAHGWIDGQLGPVDAFYFKTRFTPRKARSAWSQMNCERALRLIAEGRMRPAGLAEVVRAKADGRWDGAYAPQGRATPDADLLAALDAAPGARGFFDSLDAANRYAVLYRVQQAKTPQKRAAKIAEIVARLAAGRAYHAPRKRPAAGE